jgi:hypothetical protein
VPLFPARSYDGFVPLKRCVLAVFLLAAFVGSALAKIGDAPRTYEARFGHAIKEGFDGEKSGLSVYRTKEFQEIRVTFVKGASTKEVYKYDSEKSVPRTLIEAIRAENEGQNVFDGYNQITVESLNSDTIDYLARPDGGEKTYTGVVKEKTVDSQRWVVLSDHGTVIELPIAIPGYPQQITLAAGRTYSVTMLEELADDVSTIVGVVSKREHADWFDAVDDAGLTGIQQLVRVTEGATVVFDRSVCSRHHEKMELRTVKIGYGMYGPKSWAESYCMGNLPHFRDFALGGCVVQEPETTKIYVCAKCVAECEDYARQHPEEDVAK